MSNRTKDKRVAQPKASDLPYSPEALLALQQQYAMKRNDEWTPSVMNFKASGVPTVQTQLAGTQYYDTTDNQFMAPSYEHFKDMSVKKDLQGKEERSKYESAIEAMTNVDVGDNESYKQILMNVKEAEAIHSAKIKNGVWGFNTEDIKNFGKEVVQKKGLGQIMRINAEEKAQKDYITELSGKYDPVKGGGIAPEDLKYLMRNNGIKSDAVFDEEGNVINQLQYTPSKIVEHRNMPAEVDDTIKNVKASEMYIDKDGKGVVTILEDQYGMFKGETVTKEQIETKVRDYLMNNGGNEYLEHKAKVTAFNKMDVGNVSVDELRAIVEKRRKEEENQEGNKRFTGLDTATDVELVGQAESILAADDYLTRKESLIGAAVASGSYYKETANFFVDVDAQRRKAEAHALQLAAFNAANKASGSGSDKETDEYGMSVAPYVFATTFDQIVETLNPDNVQNTTARIADLDLQIRSNADIVKNLEAQGKAGTDNAAYVQAKDALQGYKNTKKVLQDEVNNINQSIRNVVVSKLKMIPAHIYERDFRTAYPDSTVTNEQFQNAISAAAIAEMDSNPKTTAAQIFKAAGIPTTIESKRKDGIGRYNTSNTASMSGPEFSGLTKEQKAKYVTDSSNGNLLGYVKAIAAEGKKIFAHNNKNNTKFGSDEKDRTLTLQTDLFYLEKVEGETAAKSPYAAKWNSTHDTLNKTVLPSLEGTTIYEMTGKKGVNFPKSLMDKYNFTENEWNVIFNIPESAIKPTTTQSYGQNGDIVFGVQLKLNNPTDSMPDKAKNAIKAIRKDIGTDGFYKQRINLGGNQEGYNKLFGEAAKGMIMEGFLNKKESPQIMYQQAALMYGQSSGINQKIDDLRMDSPKTKTIPPLDTGNGLLHFKRFSSDGNKSFMFTLETEQNGKKAFLTYDRKGNESYKTQQEIDADVNKEGLTKKVFNNTLDVKAFVSLGMIEAATNIEGSQKGGGGRGNYSRVDFERSTAPRYKNNVVFANGRTETHTTYVPTGQLADIRQSGIKVNASAGIPMINKAALPIATNVATTYGLTVSGGLRTDQHEVSGGAKNSAHFAGYSLDFTNDKKSQDFWEKIKGNPKLQKQLGITYAKYHDAGSGNHLHLEFAGSPSAKSTPTYKTDTNAWGSNIMTALGQGESGGKNIGNHYKDTAKHSTAYGKYGFTNEWFGRMSKIYNMTPEQIKQRPDIIDHYAKNGYIEAAKSEILPIFDKLKSTVRKYMPEFNMNDALMAYHYAGGNFLRAVAKGQRSINEVPEQQQGNKETIKEYITNKRKFIK